MMFHVNGHRIARSLFRYLSTGKRYPKASSDPIFKYLLQDDLIRNGCLSSMLNLEISSSEVISTDMMNLQSFENTRSCLSRYKDLDKKIIEIKKALLEDKDIGLSLRCIKPGNVRITDDKQLSSLFKSLILDIDELLVEDRSTRVNVLCETPTEVINVEIQVVPESFWDVHIVPQVCEIFSDQFRRGFEWKTLEADVATASTKKTKKSKANELPKRVIGISLLMNTSKNFEAIRNNLGWELPKLWEKDEVSRHFVVQTSTGIRRPGIEFYDFNLSALSNLDFGGSSVTEELREWLELFANSHGKKEEDVNALKSPLVKLAYEKIEENKLPSSLKQSVNSYESWSSEFDGYVSAEKEASKEEGKAEGKAKGKAGGEAKGKAEIVRNMYSQNLSLSDISKLTTLNDSEIRAILGI